MAVCEKPTRRRGGEHGGGSRRWAERGEAVKGAAVLVLAAEGAAAGGVEMQTDAGPAGGGHDWLQV